MGRQTSDYAKSDVDLIHENGIYKISLKQDNAEMWESADTRFGEMIRTKIDEAQKQGKVKLEPIMAAGGSVKKNQGKTVVKIVPETDTLIEFVLSFNNTFSLHSLTILPISFIAFLGIIPLISSETPSFNEVLATAKR